MINRKIKGFTLIELIAVITVIGLLLLVSFPAINNLMKKNDIKKYEAYYDIAKAAAKAYSMNMEDYIGSVNDEGCIKTTTTDLINKEYLKEIDEKNVECRETDNGIVIRNKYGNITSTVSLVCKDIKTGKIIYEKEEETESCEMWEGAKPLDTTPPTCTSSGGSTTWTNGNRTITYGCKDNDGGTGCATGFKGGTVTVSTTNKTYIVPAYTIKDNAGNVTHCPAKTVNTYVDKTNPTISYSVAGGTYYVNKTITVTNEDTNAKRMKVEVYKNDVLVSDKSTSGWVTTKTYNVIVDNTAVWKIRTIAEDEAGNKQNQSPEDGEGYYYQTYTIIKQGPTLTTITNPTNGNWTKNNFKLTVKATDNGGGIAYYEYSYDQSTWTKYANSGSTTYETTEFSAERNQLVYIRAFDNYGQVSTNILSTYIRIDKTAPTCSPSKSNTNTTVGVTITGNCSDGNSGIQTATGTVSGITGNYTVTATDNAGNTFSTTVTIAAKTQYAKRTCTTCGTGYTWDIYDAIICAGVGTCMGASKPTQGETCTSAGARISGPFSRKANKTNCGGQMIDLCAWVATCVSSTTCTVCNAWSGYGAWTDAVQTASCTSGACSQVTTQVIYY